MYQNILIVKLSAIGDVIHALPVAKAIKDAWPQARITWVVEKGAYELVAGHSYIDEVILFDKPKFKSLSGLLRHAPALVRRLRAERFDVALDLQGLFKSAAIAFLSGAGVRLVYQNTREGSHLLSRKVIGPHAAGHVTERYLDVVRALGITVQTAEYALQPTPEEARQAERIAAHAGLKAGLPYVVLALGANWPNKIWPVESFAELSQLLYDKAVIPVMIGGPGDVLLAEQVLAAAAVPPVDLTGKTTLKQLAHILQQASAVVGGDTGPMHMAAAVKAPVVALMGPTDAVRNGPYGQEQDVLVTPHACAGCWQRRCPKNWDCLAAISVGQVYQAVLRKMR